MKYISTIKWKKILLYTRMFGVKDWYGWTNGTFTGCRVKTCTVSYLEDELEIRSAEEAIKSADLVVFHLFNVANFTKTDVRKLNKWRCKNSQKFMLYNREPEAMLRFRWHFVSLEIFRRFFNWTMSHRRDSDIYFPYGLITKNVRERPIVKMNSKNKSTLWFVSNCHTYSLRERYVAELIRQGVDVDVYGQCGQNICDKQNCDEQIYENYRFYLSFENSICKEYISEKFFKVLNKNITPIVLGGAEYSKYAPEHSYIDVNDFDSPSHLAKYIKSLENDEKEYQSYFQWKRKYDALLHYNKIGWCKVCAMLHNETAMRMTTVHDNLSSWIALKPNCKIGMELPWAKYDGELPGNTSL